ncbi:hypothetical protein Tco_0830107 [Tanacetum coccineum]
MNTMYWFRKLDTPYSMEVDTPVSRDLDTAYQRFLGVGTTFDIFENILLLYIEYGVWSPPGYGILVFIPSWSFVKYRHRYAVSSLMDTAYRMTVICFDFGVDDVPGWTPDLVEDSDEEELSDDDSLEEGMKNLESENDCSNSFEVPDTVFENECGSKKNSSVDPFGLYPLLNKKTKDQKHKESGTNSSPKFPPGFTPNNDNDDTGDKKSVNDFEEEKLNEDDGDSNNSNLKENVDESASFGRFKKSVAPSSGGSFMCLMEEVVKVGQTMGYNMDGVINNLSDIIESQGASIVDR